MIRKFLFLALLMSMGASAQDIIKTRYNATITGKIIDNRPASLSYTKDDKPDMVYVMDKGDVIEIRHADGNVETFDADLYKNLSIEETKQQLVKDINEFAFIHEKDQRHLHAAFIGDKLQISETSDSGKIKESTAVLYDFAKVHSFMTVAKKPNDMGYLNIWVMSQEKESDTKQAKRKFVIMVKPQSKAFEIYHQLKHLNNLLTKK